MTFATLSALKRSAVFTRQELDNAEREGELRPLSEVSEAIVAALTPVCAMLDNLPLAIKRKCPELSHVSVETVERTIAEARNELAEQPVLVEAAQ